MKGPRSLSQILTLAVALAPLTTAWSNWLPDIDALVVRQDDGTTTDKPTETATATSTNDSEPTSTADDKKTTATDGATTTTDDAKTTKGPQTTNLNTGGKSQTGSGSGSGTASKASSTGHKSFSAIDGAGSVVMVTPALTDGSQLYKIEAPTPITWAWNYTQVQADPTAIDVLVSCSTATRTFTLTQNMTFETQASFTWDTREYQQGRVDNKLLTAEYTLLIYDADTAFTDTAEAGYLAPFSGLRFGLYAAQPYQNLSEWECVTCSAGNGDLDRKAVGFAVSMSLMTVLSFTWYVVGFAGLL